MTAVARPRIAIPQPTSFSAEYNANSFPHYVQAVEQSGGEPVEVPLSATPKEVADLVKTCEAILLPGSRADVNPQRYGASREDHTADADAKRESVDDMLLQDAYNMHKPVFGICFGTQFLNVWRSGTLQQHIDAHSGNVSHEVSVEQGSFVSRAAGDADRAEVNSSHHQVLDKAGDGLRVTAKAADGGTIEAVEGTSPQHWVLGVQWHPERSFAASDVSRRLFAEFVEAARKWKPRKVTESVAAPE